jgi:hypothetical protein
MTPPIKTAQTLAQRIGDQRRKGYAPALLLRDISLDDLDDLARAVMDAERRASTGRLSDAGLVYVTLAAAREFGAVERIHDDEAARQELTEIIADAKPNAEDPSKWRAQSRATGLDINARVKRDGRLMVVTATHTRDVGGTGRTRGGGRRRG